MDVPEALMKAICPRCGHIEFTFDAKKTSLEAIRHGGLDAVCRFHGADLREVNCETDEELANFCQCGRCIGQRKKALKDEEIAEKEIEQEFKIQRKFVNTFNTAF